MDWRPRNTVNDFWVDVAPAESDGSTLTTNTPYNVINKNSGSCVDATGWGTTNGTTVQQWACGSGKYSTQANQEWLFESAWQRQLLCRKRQCTERNVECAQRRHHQSQPDAVVDLRRKSERGVEKLSRCGDGYYEFVGEGSGLCLDTPGASTANGVQLQI